MRSAVVERTRERRGEILLGSVLLADFGLVCCVKCLAGVPQELMWVSHAGLLLVAVGLIAGSSTLIATTLILILLPHAVWLTDFAVSFLTGRSPWGVTSYLSDATWLTWLGTFHHFYLLPTLLILFARRPVLPREALPLAAACFIALSMMSRLLAEPVDNVNYAFAVFPRIEHPLVQGINELPAFVFFPGMNLFMLLCIFTPTALLLHAYSARQACGRRR